MHKESAEMLRQPELFRLKDIKKKSQLEEVERGEVVALDEVADSEHSGEEDEEEDISVTSDDEGGISGDDEEEEEEEEKEEEEEEGEGEEEEMEEGKATGQDQSNPLLIDLEKPSSTRSKRAQLWFSRAAFANLNTEGDDEAELQHMITNLEKQGGKLWTRETTKQETRTENQKNFEEKSKRKDKAVTWADKDRDSESDLGVHSSDSEKEDVTQNRKDDSDSDSDSDSADDWDNENEQSRPPSWKVKGESFEVVPTTGNKPSKIRKLAPEELAIGALLVQSKKKREDLIESAYNRWTHSDPTLPDWFCDDEAKYCQKQLPVTKEMVKEFKEKLREINARPVKKLAEAKARKKRKALKQLEKARKKAEGITDAVDVTQHEKVQQLKQIYKKAGLLGKRKKEVQYVVAKKGLASKRPKRPAGTKGPYKVVDPRMKKDNRTRKIEAKRQGRNKRRR